MPRKARIDAPGALHHIIIREIERKAIFKDNADRVNFFERLKNRGSNLDGLLPKSNSNYTPTV